MQRPRRNTRGRDVGDIKYRLKDWFPFDKIVWYGLSENPNPDAIPLLAENLEKVNWYELSKNPNAIPLLRDNKRKIKWEALSSNPSAIRL